MQNKILYIYSFICISAGSLQSAIEFKDSSRDYLTFNFKGKGNAQIRFQGDGYYFTVRVVGYSYLPADSEYYEKVQVGNDQEKAQSE